MLTLTVIGRLRTPWRSTAECPRNGRLPDPAPACVVEVHPPWWGALDGIDTFSHLILLYWLGPRTEGAPLRVKPRFDGQERGVFATRAPIRPNPIGFSLVRLDRLDAASGVLTVRYLDCMDGTPLLDIKPYLPTIDAEPEASVGWLRGGAAALGSTAGLE